ncbi:uncharacterized protein LOC119562386 isoform X2 [Drosophila subpulchrella]|uniref:uncharacterized protein LOC119562386 isoform X2 n=1 Tax=Drosophila subpulchrella TaxID=1486046 RepID=UPI0018A1B0B7|nr:uncharacterized protein LOC119562386 isoform X2 [Drosophila subpulchrella]
MELVNENPWLIKDDTLFLACGLIVSAAHAGKSVFITWNKYYLLNLRFKNRKDNTRTKMDMVRVPLPMLGEHYIRSVHTLKYNTVMLMSDGDVYCFGSIKALNLIKCVSGVRCLAVLNDGFSVIKVEDQRLLLQMYLDLPSFENVKSTLQYTFDITFDDKNIFQCEWQHDEYTLTALKVTEEEKQFVQNLLGLKEEQPHYVHIFSIAGHVFVLTFNITGLSESSYPGYHIELLCVYSSHVRCIRLLPIENLCLVVLSSGSVDMWYVSSLLAIKQSQIYHTGSEWMDYDATSDNGDIYYTDGDQLVRLRFMYNIQFDECFVHTLIKPVIGIQACTWVDHRKELACLSDNNIFYCIGFNLPIQKSSGPILKILASDLNRPMGLRQNSIVSRFEKRQQHLFERELQKEYEMQKLISVSKDVNIFSAVLKMSVEFHSHVPSCHSVAVQLQLAQDQGLRAGCIYALFNLISIESQRLLHSSHWKVLIFHDNQAHAFLLPTEILVKKKCRIVVALKKLRNEHLPYFKIQLVGLIKVPRKMCALLFPLSTEKSGNTYCALFSKCSTAGNFSQDNQMQLYKELCGPLLTQAIRKADHFTISRIASLFYASSYVNGNTLELYFSDEKLHHNATKSIFKGILESNDASAIYYFKKHIISNAEVLDIEDSQDYNDISFGNVMTESELLYGLKSNDVLDCGTKIAINPKYSAIRNAIF